MNLRNIMPFAIFALLMVMLGVKLLNPAAPSDSKSTLEGKPVPEFSLATLKNEKIIFSNADLTGKYAIINMFASWCVPCIAEHPLLMDLKEKNIIPIYGINWKDRPEELATWIEKHGNPYEKIGLDENGAAAIAFGITGVPETILVDKTGRMIYRLPGPLTADILNDEILPEIEK